MHCYSGKANMVQDFLDLGFYIGVGGPVTRNSEVQEIVKITPIERIVIETDAPLMPPNPLERSKINNSLYLSYVIKKIAEIKNMSEKEVINQTNNNAYKVYDIKET